MMDKKQNNKIMFGFSQLAKIKRPYSVFSNRSGNLISTVDLNIDYVDKNETTPRKFLEDSYKNNEKLFSNKQQQKNNKLINLREKKSETSLGFHDYKNGDILVHNNNNSKNKFSIVNKHLALREAHPEKFISKEKCKNYLKEIKLKQENEKNYVISLANGLKGENKHKFEFYLQNYDKELLKSSNNIKNRKSIVKEAFEEDNKKINDHKSDRSFESKVSRTSRSELLPKLLNSIRMTNFSTRYNDKKYPIKELQRRKSSQAILKLMNETVDHREELKYHEESFSNININNNVNQSQRQISKYKETDLLFVSKNSEIIIDDENENNDFDDIINNPDNIDKQFFDFKDVSRSTFGSLTVSTLQTSQKLEHKTKWPTVEEIENLLGIRIRPPTPKIIEEVKIEPVVDVGKTTKGIKSAVKKKEVKLNDKPTSAAKKKTIAIATAPEPIEKEKTCLSQITEKIEESKVDVQNIIKLDSNDNDANNKIVLSPVIVIKTPNEADIKNNETELPSSLCPSSLKFSKKLSVRLWVENSNFDSSSKTTPLI